MGNPMIVNAPMRVDIAQRSQEWLDWRRDLGMASEAAAMLGISPFFPRTREELWAVKSGAASVYVTPAMRQGQALEERALEALMQRVHIEFAPACYQRWKLGASLDGIDIDGVSVAEVKVPAKGSQSALYRSVLGGEIPDHYMAQIQQQLLVSGAESGYFGVYAVDLEDICFTPVLPEPEWRLRIITGWESFWRSADAGSIAPAREQRSDSAWLMAAQEYREAKAAAAVYEIMAERAKARISELADGKNCDGGGIKYTLSERKGSIDYKAALADLSPGVDLEPWRKAGGTVTRITVEDAEQ